MANCKECDKKLRNDDMAIYRRLVYRDAEEFLCRDCLAKYLGVNTAIIEQRIAYFKKIGCTLF